MINSTGYKPKTFGEHGKLTNRSIAEKVSAQIYDFPAKVIAKAAGSSVQTAENAKRGFHSMSLAHFFNAAQGVPELTALGFELLGMTKSDAEFYAKIHHMMKQQRGQP